MSGMWFAVGVLVGMAVTIAAMVICAWVGMSDRDAEQIMEDELERRIKNDDRTDS